VNAVAAIVSGLPCRRARRADLPRLLGLLADDDLGRGRGIGGRLIEQALRHARERGCAIAQLTSDKRRVEAHRFYGRLGFAASHEGFKRVPGEPL
jgi:GNAT superfamily N-acetyltransferase